ncbi:hypothetical protein CHISP_2767 [Chitinispirillum alkaliphilum]|nr:hypothetical protein CHISP_2767 [Chitinispirillum alkaliphilum]
MARLFYLMSKRLLISKRRGRVRSSVLYLFTSMLLLAAVIFLVEVILIVLGTENIFVPFTHNLVEMLPR